MKVLLQLSREHATLPKAEVISVLKGEGVKWTGIIEDSSAGLLLLEVKSKKTNFAGRLALTQKAVEIISLRRSLEEVAKEVYPKIKSVKSFAVRCESNTVERTLGALLHARGLKVNLTKPEKTVIVYKIGDFFAAGFEIPAEKNFEERHPLKRPFFHPTSMKPKTARMLVNLACLQKGKSLLDPFCGAGGILIEAGLMGLKTFGWDLDNMMLRGCEKNVRHYVSVFGFGSSVLGSQKTEPLETGNRKPKTVKPPRPKGRGVKNTQYHWLHPRAKAGGFSEGVNWKLQQHDALSKHAIKVDAVVTDPPYGKSSTTLGVKPEQLYNKFLENIRRNLKKNGRLVIVLPEQYKLEHNGFTLKQKFKIRVHKSLTRVIWVLRKN